MQPTRKLERGREGAPGGEHARSYEEVFLHPLVTYQHCHWEWDDRTGVGGNWYVLRTAALLGRGGLECSGVNSVKSIAKVLTVLVCLARF